jgi:hypothetical protein
MITLKVMRNSKYLLKGITQLGDSDHGSNWHVSHMQVH